MGLAAMDRMAMDRMGLPFQGEGNRGSDEFFWGAGFWLYRVGDVHL